MSVSDTDCARWARARACGRAWGCAWAACRWRRACACCCWRRCRRCCCTRRCWCCTSRAWPRCCRSTGTNWGHGRARGAPRRWRRAARSRCTPCWPRPSTAGRPRTWRTSCVLPPGWGWAARARRWAWRWAARAAGCGAERPRGERTRGRRGARARRRARRAPRTARCRPLRLRPWRRRRATTRYSEGRPPATSRRPGRTKARFIV